MTGQTAARDGQAPETYETDVAVVGGGPAGIGAAMAAARNGARVMLIEAGNDLGGAATRSLVPVWQIEAGCRGGIVRELLDRLLELEAVTPDAVAAGRGPACFNPWVYRMATLEAVTRSGARPMFHALAEDVKMDGARVIGVFIACKAGRRLVTAKAAVDATGDGDLAAWAGAPFEKGRDDGHLQAVSFNFQLVGVDRDRCPDRKELVRLTDQARRRGEIDLPEHISAAVQIGPASGLYPPGLFHHQTDVMFGVDPTDPESLTAGEIECQRRAYRIWRFLRESVPGFEHSAIVNMATRVGIREGRRVLGEYTLVERDVLSARKFPDGICRCSYYMDTHDGVRKTPEYKRSLSVPEGDFFEVPYRCLLPLKVEGLLVAGRAISSTRFANGSIRVQPTCINTGQAAGTAAALCVARGCQPRQIEGEGLRQILRDQGMAL